MRFYIICPANIVSGGPELAHQLCHELVENGQEAKMYYVKGGIIEPVKDSCPEKFAKYNTTSVASFDEVNSEDSIVVVPEQLTAWTFMLPKAKKVVWWMSVDNCEEREQEGYLKKLDEACLYHLVQSQYARDYLIKQSINEQKIFTLSDYIGDMYMQFIFPAQYRQNVVLYNPKKGYDKLKPLIDRCDFVVWKALIGLPEEHMVLNMQLAKLYVDFGQHPGKDRIPREAASCGCCIMTNREGSANYKEDVPIDDMYKFEAPIDYDKATEMVRDIMNNYEMHLTNQNGYRDMIKAEKGLFAAASKKFIELFY